MTIKAPLQSMSQSLNEPKPKIYINGLSWSRGEWVGPNVVHRGLEQYLTDIGYTVINTSKPRNYHSRALKNLDQHLARDHESQDIIIWIQTDPLLDVIMPELEQLGLRTARTVTNLPGFTESIQLADGLINLVRKCQHDIYTELDSLAAKYQTKIHCVGGAHNINTHILDDFKNLNPLIVSWLNLMIGHFKEYQGFNDPEFGVSYTWDLGYIDLSKYTDSFAQKIKQEYQQLSCNSVMLKEDIFHPDGLHPNREGHKILFEHIVKELKL